MAVGDKIKIDISLSNIQDTINSCNTIITNLKGSEGLDAFLEAHKMIESDFDGKYANALSNSVLEAKGSYLDSLSNVSALEMVLKEYKDFIKGGTNDGLTNIDDHVKIDMEQIYTQITNLEDTIASDNNLKNVLKNDEDFDAWLATYRDTLDDTKQESYEVDENGNMTEEGFFAHLKDQKKKRMFNANNSKLLSLNATLSGGLVATSSVVTKLEVISGVISGELSDLSAIWDAFGFNKTDIHNYLVVQYNGLSEENKIRAQNDCDFVTENFDSIINAINDCMEKGAQNTMILLNSLLSNDDTGWNAQEEDIALDSLFLLTSAILLGMNINAFTVAPEDRAEFYSRFKNLEQLNVILAHLKSATTDDGSEVVDGINNDITSVSFDAQNGKLTINRARGSSSIDVDTSILDTDGSKLINGDLEAWDDAIKNKHKETVMLLIAVGTMGTSRIGEMTVKSISVAEQQMQQSKKILAEVGKNSKEIGEIEIAKDKTIDDILGTTTDGEGNAIVNFIPIMVVNTFVLNGGDFYNIYPPGQGPFEEGDVVPVDWSESESVEAWLDSPYQGDLSVRNGTQLEAIREYFSRGYDASSDYPAGLSMINGWDIDGTLN